MRAEHSFELCRLEQKRIPTTPRAHILLWACCDEAEFLIKVNFTSLLEIYCNIRARLLFLAISRENARQAKIWREKNTAPLVCARVPPQRKTANIAKGCVRETQQTTSLKSHVRAFEATDFLHVTHATQQQFHSIEQLLPAFLSWLCTARSNISAAIILISFETHVQRFLISALRTVLRQLKQAPIESCLGCFYLICCAWKGIQLSISL